MIAFQIELDGDVYAPGYDGNWFKSAKEAKAAIPSLLEVFPETKRAQYSIREVEVDPAQLTASQRALLA